MSTRDRRAWTSVPCGGPGDVPRSQWAHACAVYRDGLYIFGGRHGSNRLNDLHEFSFTRKRWRIVRAKGRAPSPRLGHNCVVHKDSLYVFGGYDGTSTLNDLAQYKFRTKAWRAVTVAANSPPPQPTLYRSAAVYSNSMYCFGGVILADEVRSSNEFDEFNFNTGTWTAVATTGNVPSARCQSSLVVAGQSGILFGGFDGWVSHNDTHVFDFVLRTWATLDMQGPLPPPRSGHVAVVHSNTMFILGGSKFLGGGNDDADINDFHKLTMVPSGSPPKWQHLSSEGLPVQHKCCHLSVHRSSLVAFDTSDDNGRANHAFMQYRFSSDLNQLDEDLSEIPESSLVSHLRNLVNNEFASDITFVVDGTPVYAHKSMCVRCDYSKAMLSGEMLESRAREIAIQDVPRHVFLLFLEYLYTDTVELSQESAMDLIAIADRYGEDR